MLKLGHPMRTVNSVGRGSPSLSMMADTHTLPPQPILTRSFSSGSSNSLASGESLTYLQHVPISPVLGPYSSFISFLCSQFSSNQGKKPLGPSQPATENSMPSTNSCSMNLPTFRFGIPAQRCSMNTMSLGDFAQ